MQDESLLQTFRSEVSERIASLQAGLLQLEETPDNPDVMNAIFRDAHTIKGSAKMMGFVAIKELAHRMEDVLGDVKDGRLALGPSLADILLHSSDQ
ncbi:MAG: chemotaxis protein CheA, partial [Acidimicrobiia bacterium]